MTVKICSSRQGIWVFVFTQGAMLCTPQEPSASPCMESAPAISNSSHVPTSTRVPRFSIIIPLEFHRGQGEDCLRAWTQGQEYPRDQYEIVLAIPPSLSKNEAAGMVAMLSEYDQAIDLPHEHDIALCAAAATYAHGDVLFFTESHCLPERDVLQQADRAFAAHPEWSGFSCESVPITHNLLSQVEAALYDRDIKQAMQHPWRKVLDQCFVVKREAYLATGGFDPEMGHFGEWLLSARFRQRNLQLGYWPAARINHYYIGQLGEWREFTEDFAEGEMRFMTMADTDPAAALLDEAPIWTTRHALSRQRAGRMARMLYRDLRGRVFSKDHSIASTADRWRVIKAWHWREGFSWLCRGVLGSSAECLFWNWRVWRTRAALSWNLRKGDVSKADASLAALCTALARRAGNRLLRRWVDAREEAAPTTVPETDSGRWVPEKFSPQVQVGFHSPETWEGEALRWSTPVAMVELPLTRGRYEVQIDCLERPGPLDIRFYLNEKAIPTENVSIQRTAVRVRIRANHSGVARFGWVCNPYTSQGDPRCLGLAVRGVTWTLRS